MTAAEKNETKQKILQQARLLFSQHGFRGTSIRMIAEQSDVNIAAVNYHFGNKEALYWSVINEAYEWVEAGVREVSSNATDMEDFAQKLFNFLRSEQHFVLTTMKTFWSDMATPPEPSPPYSEKLKCEQMGPPGGEIVAEFILSLYPKARKEAVDWVVMCLFSSIFHFATFTCTDMFKEVKKNKTPIEMIENNLKTMATALINHMNDSSNW